MYPSGRRGYSNVEKLTIVRRSAEAAEVRGGRTRLLRKRNLDMTTALPWIEAAKEGKLGPGAKPKGIAMADV